MNRLRHRCGIHDFGKPDMNRPIDSRLGSQPLPRARSAVLSPPRDSPHTGVPRILSAELFSAGAVVEIEHDGAIYRLRHTRKGKLILTK